MGSTSMRTAIQVKLDALNQQILDWESVVIAFSGGVDSTFLLKAAHQILEDRTLAVIIQSSFFPQREHTEALQFVQSEKIRHVVIEVDERDIERFTVNDCSRCYFCKKYLFTRIRQVADEKNIRSIAEGTNADDSFDDRPGMRAIAELGILSPLQKAGLTKQDIRQLSGNWGLPTQHKPSFACLASRIPFGTAITKKRLVMIEYSEQYLLDMGFQQVRVRLHENLARIETDEEGFAKWGDKKLRKAVYARMKEIGFVYVSVDILGYRTGSMNEPLRKAEE